MEAGLRVFEGGFHSCSLIGSATNYITCLVPPPLTRFDGVFRVRGAFESPDLLSMSPTELHQFYIAFCLHSFLVLSIIKLLFASLRTIQVGRSGLGQKAAYQERVTPPNSASTEHRAAISAIGSRRNHRTSFISQITLRYRVFDLNFL